jgi:hypothetical protein
MLNPSFISQVASGGLSCLNDFPRSELHACSADEIYVIISWMR